MCFMWLENLNFWGRETKGGFRRGLHGNVEFKQTVENVAKQKD